MSKLPLDLAKFRKIKADEKSSVFQHEDGHQITVAHGKLSTKLRSQIDKIPMAKQEPQKFAEGTDEVTPSPFSVFDPSGPGQGPQTLAMNDAPRTGLNLDVDDSTQPVEVNVPGVTQQNSVTPEQARGDGLSPSAENGPGPANPPASPASQDPYGTMAALQGQLGGIQKQGAGQEAEARAAGQMGAANLPHEHAYQKTLDTAKSVYDQTLNDIGKEHEAFLKDYNNGHIDPQRYIKGMSTGAKISSGIGLILGGMGAGLTHGPNLAFKYLQDQVDKDIEAQKSDVNSHYNNNLIKYRNASDAFARTRLEANDVLASQLRTEADKVADPIAKARALQIAGMIDQNSGKMAQEIAMTKYSQHLMNSQNGETNPSMAIQMLAPPAQREALMKDLKTKQDMDRNIQNMMGAFDKIAGQNTVLNKLNPQAQSLMDAEWDPKMVKLAHESAGRFNMEELPIMNKYKPNAIDTKATKAQKREAFYNDLVERAHFPSLEPYGVRGGGSTQAAPQIRFKPLGAK